MDSLAHKLMTLNEVRSDSVLARALYLKPRFRIGLWPGLSSNDPQTAMGVFSLLAYLLENWQDVCLYRVFVALEGEPQHYQWTIEQSQFEVDDWEIEGLDENIAVWGNLHQSDKGLSLEIEIENDLAPEDDDNALLKYDAATLSGLISQLPQIADDMAAKMGFQTKQVIALAFDPVTADDVKLAALLHRAFHWEREILLHLWGHEISEDAILRNHEALRGAGQSVGGEVGAWSIGKATARALLPGIRWEALLPKIPSVVESFPYSDIPALLIGRALFGLDYDEEGFELLEDSVETFPDSPLAWLALADGYVRAQQPLDALDALQRAIESGVRDERLYTAYAALLVKGDYEEWPVTEFVLSDPAEKEGKLLIWEAVEAYQQILDDDPANASALYGQLIQIVDNGLRDKRLWSGFERLLNLDVEGEKVRGVIDSFYSLEDISPAITILEQSVKTAPTRADLLINLAAIYLIDEQSEKAHKELNRARTLTTDEAVLADIDRLNLAADDPEFDQHLAELADILEAGGVVEVEDVEFLEDAVTKVPTFADGYLLLARAYKSWDEPATALETLLDGHKYLPDDPDIAQMTGQLLWETGQQRLAMEYLNKGLTKNPRHVPLLAIMGLYLFEDGQEDEAKVYFARAEALGPNDSTLKRSRIQLAKLLSEQDVDEAEES